MRFNYFLLAVYSLIFFSCSQKVSTSGTYTKSKTSQTKTKQPVTTTTRGAEIVQEAKKYLGTRYKYGGIDKRGLDCSGLIYTVFKSKGISMPRVSAEQATKGRAVYIGELQLGDLIFFGAKKGSKKITHAGIVSFSNGKTVKIIHSSSSKGVIEVDIANYWRDKYIKARRII